MHHSRAEDLLEAGGMNGDSGTGPDPGAGEGDGEHAPETEEDEEGDEQENPDDGDNGEDDGDGGGGSGDAGGGPGDGGDEVDAENALKKALAAQRQAYKLMYQWLVASVAVGDYLSMPDARNAGEVSVFQIVGLPQKDVTVDTYVTRTRDQDEQFHFLYRLGPVVTFLSRPQSTKRSSMSSWSKTLRKWTL